LATQVLREIKSGRDLTALIRVVAEEGTVASVAQDYMKRAGGKLRSAKQRQYDLDQICSSLGSRAIADVRQSDLARMRDRLEEHHGPAAADRALVAWSGLAEWYASRSDDFRPPSIRRLRIRQEARDRVLKDTELRSIWSAADVVSYPFGPFVK